MVAVSLLVSGCLVDRFLARVAVGGLLILLLPFASIARGGMVACYFAAVAVSTAIAACGAPWGRVICSG